LTDDAVFSRPVKVDTLPRDGLRQKIAANADERGALARQFGLVSVGELKADFLVQRVGRCIRVSGMASAEVTQTCVVTLEPFDAEIEEEVDVRFAPPPAEDHKGRGPETEAKLQFDDEDEPDPIIDGKIDLGALAAEFVALGLDPYPRKPDAAFDPPIEEDEEEKPFAALKGLKSDPSRD